MINSATPPAVDLTKVAPAKLRDLMRRYQEQGFSDLAASCLSELSRRGAAKRGDFANLVWNHNSVRQAFAPFSDVARGVVGNQRTAFTEAGGTKIGRPKDDPSRNWVDTYSAIKTARINAAFVCYILKPGDDPLFQLHKDGVVVQTFNYDQLAEALIAWKALALEATN